jgi:polygalacturonase
VRDHGAAGDGVTLDTGAINRAIMACAEAGGGQVLFPPGTYLSGTVHLKSGITLYFDAGSALVGTANLAETFASVIRKKICVRRSWLIT